VNVGRNAEAEVIWMPQSEVKHASVNNGQAPFTRSINMNLLTTANSQKVAKNSKSTIAN
jgi:hypothetical protein